MAESPHDSYILCGQVSTSGGEHPNGITMTITNTDTSESITTTTETDSHNDEGTYQVNLGNLESGWSRGANITVTASGTHTGSNTTVIPETGTLQVLNITVTVASSGGGSKRPEGTGVIGPLGDTAIVAVCFILLVGAAFVGAYAFKGKKQ
jgi:hypothetical protein